MPDKLVEIWGPLIGTGTHEDPWRPDIPAELDWSSDEGAPTDFSTPDFGPFCQYFNVLVNEKDVAKCTKRFADKDVSERDKLIVAMIRGCRGDYGAKADAFFDGIPNVASADDARKQVVKDVLVQAACRGLSAQKAEAIRIRLVLPLAEEQASGR